MKTIIVAFTLIELLVVIAIVGILMAVGIPTYQSYTRRAHFTEVVQAAAPYKLGVMECYQMTGKLDNCEAGTNGVPTAIISGEGAGLIDAITVSEQGVITVTPKDEFGIESQDTYVLTPAITNGHVRWKTSGGGVSLGYAK